MTGEGELLDFQAVNDNNEGSIWLQLFDGSDKPTIGARPKRSWFIESDRILDEVLIRGRPFKTGCCLTFSSTLDTFTEAQLASTGRVGAIEATFNAKDGQ